MSLVIRINGPICGPYKTWQMTVGLKGWGEGDCAAMLQVHTTHQIIKTLLVSLARCGTSNSYQSKHYSFYQNETIFVQLDEFDKLDRITHT